MVRVFHPLPCLALPCLALPCLASPCRCFVVVAWVDSMFAHCQPIDHRVAFQRTLVLVLRSRGIMLPWYWS